MALKLKITKEEYDALSEEMQGLYGESAQEGGGFMLDVTGMEDTGALKRAKDHEKDARKKAELAAKEAQNTADELAKKLADLDDEGHRKQGDIKALEDSYQKKLEAQEATHKLELEKVTGALRQNTVEATAMKLATELSGDNANIILPHIRSRLGFEMEDGTAKVRVLDNDGNPSADSVDDLKNFYFTNDTFAPIVVGSRASGGGAAGSKGGGGATKKKLSEMTGVEEVAFAKEHPEEYEKMVAEASV